MVDSLDVRVDTNPADVLDAVPLAGKLRVFPRFRAYATGVALPWDVALEAEYQEGRFRAQKLSVIKRAGGVDIANESLRLIPVARIMKHAAERVIVEGEWGRNIVDWGPASIPANVAVAGPTDQTLIVVAALYKLAYAVSVPPTAYVAERMEVSRSTAGKWVGLARKARHLGPAIGTKAGEA